MTIKNSSKINVLILHFICILYARIFILRPFILYTVVMWACGPTIVKVVLSFANVSSNCQKGMGQFGGVGDSGTNATKRAVLCVGRKYVRRQH